MALRRVIASLRKGTSQPARPSGTEWSSLPVTRVLFTTSRYPLFYMAITKCGCTFMKNLLWSMEHGRPHPDPDSIHQHEDEIPRALSQTVAEIRDSPHAFTILRDPVDRFLSFYFDKIWGDGPQTFGHIRSMLAEEEGVDLSRDLDAAGHRANCLALIGWLDRNLRGETDRRSNPHWRPQASRLHYARQLSLTRLTLDGLDWQLPLLLEPLVPDIAERMAAVGARNASYRPVARADVVDDALKAEVDRVYAADRRAYDRRRRQWDKRRP